MKITRRMVLTGGLSTAMGILFGGYTSTQAAPPTKKPPKPPKHTPTPVPTTGLRFTVYPQP